MLVTKSSKVPVTGEVVNPGEEPITAIFLNQ